MAEMHHVLGTMLIATFAMVAMVTVPTVGATPVDLPTVTPTVIPTVTPAPTATRAATALACPAKGDPPHPLCGIAFPDDFGAEVGASTAPGRKIVAAGRRVGLDVAEASLLACGGWGCGYKLRMASTSDGGLGNATFIVKRFHTEYALTVEFTYEVARRLGEHCPSVQRPVAYCPNGNHVHRHNPAGIGFQGWLDSAVAAVATDPDAARATAMAARVVQQVVRWVRHMLDDLAPCVARRGLITEDLDPENSWVDDRDDPEATISAFDIDFWAWTEWYGATPAEAVRMNQERIADTYSRALSRIEGSRLTAPLQPVLAYLRPFLTTSPVDWEPFVHVYRFAVDPMLSVFRNRFRPDPDRMRLTGDPVARQAYFTQYHEPVNFEPGPGAEESGQPEPDPDAWERCIGPRFWARTREERCCRTYAPDDAAAAPAYSCNTLAVRRVCAEIYETGTKIPRKSRKKKLKKKKLKKKKLKKKKKKGQKTEL